MSTTTFFGIELPGGESQDWQTALNAALSTLTEVIVRTQLPAGARLLWGDVAGGKYLEATSTGVRVVGGLNCGGVAVRNFVVQQGTAFPADYWLGMLFLRTDENVMYRRGASLWIAIGDASSEAGGLLVSDLGSPLGSFATADGEGGVTQRAPGAAKTVLYSDSGSPSGWSLATVLGLLGYALTRGQIVAGGDDNTAQVIDPGADDTLLVADAGADAGVSWKTITALLGTLLTTRGQTLAGGVDGPVVVAAPVSNARVPLSDATQPGGWRWALQTELGAIPGTRTRVAGDLYLHANYI